MLGLAPRGAYPSFSSKAHFLEAQQDPRAGLFGHPYKG